MAHLSANAEKAQAFALQQAPLQSSAPMAQRTKTRRAIFLICGTTAAVFAFIGAGLASLAPRDDAEPLATLQLTSPSTNTTSKVIPDDLLLKYNTANRLDSYVSATEPVAIFVHSTGVQVPIRNGWKLISEEQRNEIWRLKPGVIHQLCVERPQAEGWRVVVKYGKEMHGLKLFRANLHQAWITRSFANWNGKTWGGGKFDGTYELVSDQIFSP
jgi:hypothetical protein